jgi:hypothetical protein
LEMVNDTGGVAAAGKNHIEHVGLIMHVSRQLTGLVCPWMGRGPAGEQTCC